MADADMRFPRWKARGQAATVDGNLLVPGAPWYPWFMPNRGLQVPFVYVCENNRLRMWRFSSPFSPCPGLGLGLIYIRIVCTLYRYHRYRKSLPFFPSSLTTRPNSTKYGTVVATGEADSRAKFHLAAFLCCWEAAHEIFEKQQKLVKWVKNWTFANGYESNCAGVVLCAECENEA